MPAETPGRFVTGSRAPGVNSYSILYTVPASTHMIYGVDVCNGGGPRLPPPHTGQDAHISIYICPTGSSWGGGGTAEPPVDDRVVYNQLVECDGVDGNTWVMPVKHLEPGDRVVVFTDTANVTFYGHGFSYT